jgi:hypothetical protein
VTSIKLKKQKQPTIALVAGRDHDGGTPGHRATHRTRDVLLVNVLPKEKRVAVGMALDLVLGTVHHGDIYSQSVVVLPPHRVMWQAQVVGGAAIFLVPRPTRIS